MAATVSFIALALMAVCAAANVYDPTVVTITPSATTLPYYPVDSPAYNDLKRSLYVMNQALGSVVFNSQAYYDYYHLNKYNPSIYQPDFSNSLSKLGSAENYLSSSYNDYQRALNAYKASLNPAVSPIVINDNVDINNPALFAL